jgi:argininosuccinate lyase
VKKTIENKHSLEELLKNVTDENIHPEILTLNEDEILVALSKVLGTDDILSKSEKAKYLESIKKLNKNVRKEPLQFKDGFSI